jgi:hypothetical protein
MPIGIYVRQKKNDAADHSRLSDAEVTDVESFASC